MRSTPARRRYRRSATANGRAAAKLEAERLEREKQQQEIEHKAAEKAAAEQAAEAARLKEQADKLAQDES